jgi:hypothetical protein
VFSFDFQKVTLLLSLLGQSRDTLMTTLDLAGLRPSQSCAFQS